MDRKRLVKVVIGGEEYSLRSERSEDYTRAVAEHVNQALRDVQSIGPIIESQKAAILAALAVTDELFQARLAARELEQRLQSLTDKMTRMLPPKKRPSRATGAFAPTGDDR